MTSSSLVQDLAPFAKSVYLDTNMTLSRRDPATLVPLAKRVIAIHDRTHSTFSKTLSRSPAKCAKGCSWCCHIRVNVTIPEAVLILESIQQLAPELRSETLARIKMISSVPECQKIAWWTQTQTACPFLFDNACVVYATRPLACRGWTSGDASACKAAFDSRDPERRVPILEGPRALKNAAVEGITLGIKNNKLHLRDWELVSTLHKLIENPDALKSWLNGSSL